MSDILLFLVIERIGMMNVPLPLMGMVALTLLVGISPDLFPDEKPPLVRIENVRRVFDNGEHNAFTDLCRFRGRLYLTFRSCPDGHMVHPTSSIRILSSEDGTNWEQVHQFSVPLRDVRDPHFLVFQEKLFVYTGTWYCGETSPRTYDLNQHLGYAVWTENGTDWQGPRMLEGTYGHYIWRAAAYQEKAYLCGRRKEQFAETTTRQQRDPIVQSALLESDDGLTWRTRSLFQETWGDETAFYFDENGTIHAVARCGGMRPGQVCRSEFPYTRWERHDLDRYIGGPLLVNWQGFDLVGGRKIVNGKPTTTLYWLIDNELRTIAELPSAGDNSYPGFVELSPGHGLISWYSTHEHDAQGKPITAIYLADLVLERP